MSDVPALSPLPADFARPKVGRRRATLLCSYAATVFFLLNLNFFLPRLMPGDPIAVLINGASVSGGKANLEIDSASRAELARHYGLDRPLVEQYGRYIGGLTQGDLGSSIRYNTPVTTLMGNRLKWSALLIGASVLISTFVGLVAGIHSGWKRGRRLDRGLLGLFVALGNIPVFVLASLALIIFAVKLHWFPLAGAQTPFVAYGPIRRALDIAHHLVLPATVMALQFVFLQYLVMRGGMVSELGADHLLLGRAKGLRERRLKYRYAGRNALLPVVTIAGLNVGVAVAVSIFVERVFAYPGLGQLMFNSVNYRDYPTMQGCFLVISLLVVSVNLMTDLLYPRLDPRVAE